MYYFNYKNEQIKQIDAWTLSQEQAIIENFQETTEEIEKAYDGSWYIKGYAPAEPEKTYVQKRQEEYPRLEEQLDMMYWDKVNNTNLWQQKIDEIKTKYPKA